MLSSLCKKSLLGLRLQLSCVCNRNGTPSAAETATSFLLRHFLSTTTTTAPLKPPISSSDYLVKSLGPSLSPESESELGLIIATNKHKQICLKSTSNADSVLALFRDYGFTNTQIASTLSKCPKLLSFDPHQCLKPKLHFFSENGISIDDRAQIIANKPYFLQRSLHNAIIPCFNFLSAFYGGNTQAIVSHLSTHGGPHLMRWFSESVPLNVETLRRHGIPHSNIVHFMMTGANTLSRVTQTFNKALMEVKEMGFDPSSMAFLLGLKALTGMSKATWVKKVEVFKRFGWSDQEVLAMFVKLPNVMDCSEEKLMRALEYFTERVRWTKDVITNYPSLLYASIDKRICPRLCVLEILMAKGLVKKSDMGQAFLKSEDKFLTRFVVKYQEDIPQLLEIYQKNKGTGC